MSIGGGSLLDELIAGTVGGVVGMAIIYPLDTAKCLAQVENRSALTVLRARVASHGVASLYRGLAAPATSFGAVFATSFAANSFALKHIREYRGLAPDADLSVGDLTLAGAFAGAVQSPPRQVMERIKTFMQVRIEESNGKAPYRWSGECVADLVRREGIMGGLLRGLPSTFLREVPQFAIYYPVYDLTKRALASAQGVDVHDLGVGGVLISGGVAGVTQWIPSYPADVIKSKLQSSREGEYRGTWDCFQRTLKTGGWRALWVGLDVAIVRAFPLHALIFCGYEVTRKQLDAWRVK